MLPRHDGRNINGPSLIRVPSWVANPLGAYYLYFAHHAGSYLRLAYADRLDGPWKIHEPGVLRLDEAPGCQGHLASPDVHIDDDRREILMYFHGIARAVPGQMTFLARSPDGLRFTASDEILGISYFRVFPWDDWWYAIAKNGRLFRSRDPRTPFEEGANPFAGADRLPRHVAVHRVDTTLWVYFSNLGDAPERILRGSIDLADDWQDWTMSAPEELLRPETRSEGARLRVRASVSGAAHGREHALRDPAIFVEDGRVYLLSSVAGESGIAIAECLDDPGNPSRI